MMVPSSRILLMVFTLCPTVATVEAPRISLNGVVVDGGEATLRLGSIPLQEERAVELSITNRTKARVVLDAFSLHPAVLAEWGAPSEGLSTRAALNGGESMDLKVRVLSHPGEVGEIPRVVLMDQWRAVAAVNVVYVAPGGATTSCRKEWGPLASGLGEDSSDYTFCCPPPLEGYVPVGSPAPTVESRTAHRDRTCGSWATCERLADGPDGICYRIKVQGHGHRDKKDRELVHFVFKLGVDYRLVEGTPTLEADPVGQPATAPIAKPAKAQR